MKRNHLVAKLLLLSLILLIAIWIFQSERPSTDSITLTSTGGEGISTESIGPSLPTATEVAREETGSLLAPESREVQPTDGPPSVELRFLDQHRRPVSGVGAELTRLLSLQELEATLNAEATASGEIEPEAEDLTDFLPPQISNEEGIILWENLPPGEWRWHATTDHALGDISLISDTKGPSTSTPFQVESNQHVRIDVLVYTGSWVVASLPATSERGDNVPFITLMHSDDDITWRQEGRIHGPDQNGVVKRELMPGLKGILAWWKGRDDAWNLVMKSFDLGVNQVLDLGELVPESAELDLAVRIDDPHGQTETRPNATVAVTLVLKERAAESHRQIPSPAFLMNVPLHEVTRIRGLVPGEWLVTADLPEIRVNGPVEIEPSGSSLIGNISIPADSKLDLVARVVRRTLVTLNVAFPALSPSAPKGDQVTISCIPIDGGPIRQTNLASPEHPGIESTQVLLAEGEFALVATSGGARLDGIKQNLCGYQRVTVGRSPVAFHLPLGTGTIHRGLLLDSDGKATPNTPVGLRFPASGLRQENLFSAISQADGVVEIGPVPAGFGLPESSSRQFRVQLE